MDIEELKTNKQTAKEDILKIGTNPLLLLKELSENAELGIHLTTYTARHSFATQMKSSGASTEFISESLGHSSLAVTENYLASFSQEEKKKWAEKLMDL